MIFEISTFILSISVAVPSISYAIDYNIQHNLKSYILTKLQSHSIVFLGTRHKQPPILNFISELLTALNDSGVTRIGLEIASDQQGIIDHFMKTGAGLDDVQIHPQIDCQEYQNLFIVFRDKVTLVARHFDCMAKSITDYQYFIKY